MMERRRTRLQDERRWHTSFWVPGACSGARYRRAFVWSWPKSMVNRLFDNVSRALLIALPGRYEILRDNTLWRKKK